MKVILLLCATLLGPVAKYSPNTNEQSQPKYVWLVSTCEGKQMLVYGDDFLL